MLFLVGLWPAMSLVLRGHAMRDRLDTRDTERFDAAGVRRGAAVAAGGGGALVLAYDWLADGWRWLGQSWPW